MTINADIKNNQNIGADTREQGIMIRVVGESMVPDIQNLDIVLCKKVDTKVNAYSSSNKRIIPLLDRKKFYVIETRNHGVMVKKVQIESSNLILNSSNRNFDAILIDQEDVISIWEVVRLLRTFDEKIE